VTSGGDNRPNSAHALPLTLGPARAVEIDMTPRAGKLPLSPRSAHRAADPLRRRRRPCCLERLPAFATSKPHRRSVWPPPSSRWINIPPRRWAGSRGGMDQYPAAKWICLTPPLKPGPAAGRLVRLRAAASPDTGTRRAGRSTCSTSSGGSRRRQRAIIWTATLCGTVRLGRLRRLTSFRRGNTTGNM
jgi:hypothetical protein